MKQHLVAPDGTMVVVVKPGVGRIMPSPNEGETEAAFWSRLHGEAVSIRVAGRADRPDKLVATLVMP